MSGDALSDRSNRSSLPRARLRDGARRAVEGRLAGDLQAYRRADFLRRFPRLGQETIEAETMQASRLVLRELERALRAERARAGHWSYDLSRHMSLLVAHRAEEARLSRLGAQAPAGERRGALDVAARTERN